MLHADGILFNQRAALQYNQQMGPGWGAPFFSRSRYHKFVSIWFYQFYLGIHPRSLTTISVQITTVFVKLFILRFIPLVQTWSKGGTFLKGKRKVGVFAFILVLPTLIQTTRRKYTNVMYKVATV